MRVVKASRAIKARASGTDFIRKRQRKHTVDRMWLSGLASANMREGLSDMRRVNVETWRLHLQILRQQPVISPIIPIQPFVKPACAQVANLSSSAPSDWNSRGRARRPWCWGRHCFASPNSLLEYRFSGSIRPDWGRLSGGSTSRSLCPPGDCGMMRRPDSHGHLQCRSVCLTGAVR